MKKQIAGGRRGQALNAAERKVAVMCTESDILATSSNFEMIDVSLKPSGGF